MRSPKEREALGLPPDGLPKEFKGKRGARRLKEHLAVAATGDPDPLVDAPVPLKRRNKEPEPLPSAFTTDSELLDIWERRMLNPDVRMSKPIRINIPGMHIRWINLAQTGRFQRARYEEGWVPVKKDELVDEREIYGVSYASDGAVCRGERQQEMLMKIPEAIWKKIRARKYELIKKSQRDLKANMQAAGAKHFSDKYNSNVGEQTANLVDTFKGDIKFGTEKVDASEFLEGASE